MVTVPTTLEIFTVIIIDSGVLMDARMFQTMQTAELYVLQYVNSADEVKKRGGNPVHFRNYKELSRWMNRNPVFSAHIVYNKFNLTL